jgi:hypothetical protein
MKSIALIGAGLAAAVAAGASASVTNLTVEYGGLVGGRHVWSVYVNSSNVNNVMLNVIGHTVIAGSMAGVQHNDNDVLDDGPGTWNAGFTTGSSQRANDSYVTVTGLTGSSAATNLDPSFGDGLGAQIPDGAGWFAANAGSPPSFTGGRIKIMQVAGATYSNAAGGAFYTARLTVGYKLNASATTPLYAENLTYTIGIPAPGALALLGLAGLASRRRRA